jgi:diadenylate cyclase
MNPTELLQRFAELLRRPPITWWDVLDILIVSILIYELLKLIRGTRAVQMAVGIASIIGLFYLSRGLQLETLNWLIRNIIGYVVFAAIVLLQADIRRALVHLGRGRLFRRFDRKVSDDDTVEELVVAATTLSAKKTGAIVVNRAIDRAPQLHRERHSPRCEAHLRSAGQHLSADVAAA